MDTNTIKWAFKLPTYSFVRLLGGAHSPLESRYHTTRRIPSIARACNCTPGEAEAALKEAEDSKTLIELRLQKSNLPWEGFFRAASELFAICRLTKPSLMIETGVGTGFSSAHILEAMRLNQNGRLLSVDLPNADTDWKLGKGKSAGFLVPEELRSRWKLVLGDSNKELPDLLADNPVVDIFFHDSQHTYNTMSFEFNSAWPHLREGGLLISDDAMWNDAILKLASMHGSKVRFVYHTGGSLPIAYVKKSSNSPPQADERQ